MPSVPRLRAITATLLALGLACGGLLAGGQGAAHASALAGAVPAPVAGEETGGDGATAETEESTTPDPVPELVIAPSEAVLRPDSTQLEVSVLLRNPGAEELPAGEILVGLGAEAVTDSAALHAQHSIGIGTQIGALRVGATPAGKTQALSLTVARADLPIAATAPFGVHLLRAELVPEGETAPSNAPAEDAAGADETAADPQLLTASTPLVWRGTAPLQGSTGTAQTPDTQTPGAQTPGAQDQPATPPVTLPTVSLGLIVPLVLPDDIHTLPTRAQLEALAPEWDRLVTQARAQRGTLAIDPRIISGIRAYGSEAPENARQLLDRMTTLDLPSFLLQFADADPAAQAALGFTKLLSPSSLDFVTRFGTFPDAATGAPSGSGPGGSGASDSTGTGATPDPGTESGTGSDPADAAETADAADTTDAPPAGEDAAPALPELLAWDSAERIAWPAAGAANAQTIDFLRTNGIRTTVLNSTNVALEGGPRAQLSDGTAYVADAALGDAASAALSGETAAERAAGSALVAAELALAAQSGSTGVLLALDRGAVASAEHPNELIAQIAGLDWVAATPLAELAEGTATLRAGDTLEERRELLRSAVGRESSVTKIGAVLVNPEYLSGYQRTRLLELFATRHAAPEREFDEVAAAYRARDAELLEGVQAISTEHTQLVGTSTRVPVQLRNTLPFDARVHVQVDPASGALSLSERSFDDVVVPAEGNQQLLVPVHSRVSSGESGLVVSISAPSGDPTVFTGTMPISIRSSVEAIALWSLGVIAASLLGFGIWRSLRRRSRARAAEPVPSAQE